MHKQILMTLLAGGLSLTTVLPAKAQSVFADIESNWAKSSILHMYQAGIINGMGDGHFAPDGQVTREQMTKMLLLALGIPAAPGSSVSFADVPETRWSHAYVEAALAKSIIANNLSGNFQPEAPVTRMEVAQWVSRAVPPMNTGIAGGQQVDFIDTKDLPSDVQEAISHVYHLGVMIGDDGLFRPHDPLTRAEATVLIERLLERIQSQMGGQEMAFKRVDLEAVSGAVNNWAQTKKSVPGLHSASFEGKTYILVSRGQKPNPGYGIKIQNVVEEPNRIVVSVTISNPEPGKMYAQVITTPYDLVVISQTAKPIELKTPIE